LFVCSAVKIDSFGSRIYLFSSFSLSDTEEKLELKEEEERTERYNMNNRTYRRIQKDISHHEYFVHDILSVEETCLLSLTVEMTSCQHSKGAGSKVAYRCLEQPFVARRRLGVSNNADVYLHSRNIYFPDYFAILHISVSMHCIHIPTLRS
jgi:hypothetical protein